MTENQKNKSNESGTNVPPWIFAMMKTMEENLNAKMNKEIKERMKKMKNESSGYLRRLMRR